MQSVKRVSAVRLSISLVLLSLAVWTFFHRTYVLDQVTVWQYKPSSEIQAITERSSLSNKGTFLFYASKPQVQDRTAFNENCRKHQEKTAILGCYTARSIYLFNVTDPRLDGIKEVTAAHEMLHAAYDRLDDNERRRVDAMLEAAAQRINNDSINKKLALYEQTEPGERLNELHSMLGSEVKDLPADLETYYGQYFINRLSLVALAEKYEQVFAELEDQQKQLVTELNNLAAQIDTDNGSYNARFGQLQEDIQSFNERAEAGGFQSQQQFTSERNALISRQSQLTTLRASILASIKVYDEKRAQLDALNGTASGLQNSIDSSSIPEVPSL